MEDLGASTLCRSSLMAQHDFAQRETITGGVETPISCSVMLATAKAEQLQLGLGGSVLKQKPKARFSVTTEPKPKLKPKPRFCWGSKSIFRPP